MSVDARLSGGHSTQPAEPATAVSPPALNSLCSRLTATVGICDSQEAAPPMADLPGLSRLRPVRIFSPCGPRSMPQQRPHLTSNDITPTATSPSLAPTLPQLQLALPHTRPLAAHVSMHAQAAPTALATAFPQSMHKPTSVTEDGWDLGVVVMGDPPKLDSCHSLHSNASSDLLNLFELAGFMSEATFGSPTYAAALETAPDSPLPWTAPVWLPGNGPWAAASADVSGAVTVGVARGDVVGSPLWRPHLFKPGFEVGTDSAAAPAGGQVSQLAGNHPVSPNLPTAFAPFPYARSQQAAGGFPLRTITTTTTTTVTQPAPSSTPLAMSGSGQPCTATTPMQSSSGRIPSATSGHGAHQTRGTVTTTAPSAATPTNYPTQAAAPSTPSPAPAAAQCTSGRVGHSFTHVTPHTPAHQRPALPPMPPSPPPKPTSHLVEHEPEPVNSRSEEDATAMEQDAQAAAMSSVTLPTSSPVGFTVPSDALAPSLPPPAPRTRLPSLSLVAPLPEARPYALRSHSIPPVVVTEDHHTQGATDPDTMDCTANTTVLEAAFAAAAAAVAMPRAAGEPAVAAGCVSDKKGLTCHAASALTPTPAPATPAARRKAAAAGSGSRSGTGRKIQLSAPLTTVSRQASQRGAGNTSRFRGVTRHRHTLKWEAHLWDSSVQRSTKGKGGRTRGKQVYLGGFSTEEEAAHAYDRAALVFWGDSAQLNFMLSEYADELPELRALSREDCVSWLRRSSSGFARGASRYRGVTRHHQHGKWESRIGRVDGKKYMYLGTYDSEREAGVAYDHAVIQFRGVKAVTNFPVRLYQDTATGDLLPLEDVLAVCRTWPEPEAPPPTASASPTYAAAPAAPLAIMAGAGEGTGAPGAQAAGARAAGVRAVRSKTPTRAPSRRTKRTSALWSDTSTTTEEEEMEVEGESDSEVDAMSVSGSESEVALVSSRQVSRRGRASKATPKAGRGSANRRVTAVQQHSWAVAEAGAPAAPPLPAAATGTAAGRGRKRNSSGSPAAPSPTKRAHSDHLGSAPLPPPVSRTVSAVPTALRQQATRHLPTLAASPSGLSPLGMPSLSVVDAPAPAHASFPTIITAGPQNMSASAGALHPGAAHGAGVPRTLSLPYTAPTTYHHQRHQAQQHPPRPSPRPSQAQAQAQAQAHSTIFTETHHHSPSSQAAPPSYPHHHQQQQQMAVEDHSHPMCFQLHHNQQYQHPPATVQQQGLLATRSQTLNSPVACDFPDFFSDLLFSPSSMPNFMQDTSFLLPHAPPLSTLAAPPPPHIHQQFPQPPQQLSQADLAADFDPFIFLDDVAPAAGYTGITQLQQLPQHQHQQPHQQEQAPNNQGDNLGWVVSGWHK